MLKTSNFPESPYFFKQTPAQPICDPLGVPKPLVLKIFFDVFELDRGSLRSIGRFKGSCKFLWNIGNTPALWKVIYKSLPLSDYTDCEDKDYYNLCKQYNIAAKNVAKGKYWQFAANSISVWTKNILAIRSEKEPNYICNLFHTECYKIDEKKFEFQGFDKFLIDRTKLEILDLSSEKTNLLNVANGFVTGDHVFDELSISMCKELMCFEEKLIASLNYDAELKKIYMKIWDIRTRTCQSTKEILDTSKPGHVEFFCKQLPFMRKEQRKRKAGENPCGEITIFDSRKEKSHSYSFKVQNDEDISFRSPQITDKYIVYCGIDNVLTFLNRESEKLTFIDLGGSNKNLMAMSILRGLMRIPNAKIYSKENIFIYYALADNNLEIWDILTGKQISKGEHRLYNVFEHQILIYDESRDCEIFYDLKLQEKFAQNKGCMAMSINERYLIINVPHQYSNDRFLKLKEIQIYDTVSNIKIALELPNGISVLRCGIADIYRGRMISALWDDFLAISGKQGTEDDEMNYVFIFDIRNGKHLRSIPIQLNSDSDYITNLEWLNGCLKIEHTKEEDDEEEEPAFIFIAFQEKNPFPSANNDKK